MTGPAPAVMPLFDEDAGVVDPFMDPRNRNESEALFRSLLPREHRWAAWPMPDSSPQAKVKPSYSVSGEVIVDNVTGLRWQRTMPKVYPGCEASYEYVGRLHGVGTGCTWEEANAYCARPELAQELGGGSWRLPTKIELESLIDTSRVNCVDPLFDDFPIDRVWSGTPILNPSGLKLAWALDFMVGSNMDSGRFKAGRVRCVSSSNEADGREPDYRIEAEVVRDNQTELEWQRYPDSATRNFADARAYCEGLDIEGGGWRLPTLKELLTLIDPASTAPAVQRAAFGSTHSDRYWTATDFLDGRGAIYKVDFRVGGVSLTGTSDELHYMRCVR